jgi:hypothetical protein
MISLRFWRWFPRRSDSSTAAKTPDSSAIADVSPFVEEQDRKASKYSRLETIAAVSVIAGVLAENWDDFGMFYAHPNWAVGRVAIGGVVVAVGIALEILFSSRASSAERKIRDWYAIKVAEINLRVALAEQAAADANLARAKIEQRMRPRVLDETETIGLINLLAPYQKTRIEIIVFDVHIGEPLLFSDQIASLFVSAGFASVRHWEAQAGTHRIAGPSVIIAVAKGHEDEFRELANTLARGLRALSIDCGVGLGVFGCEGPNNHGLIVPYEFGPPQYRLRFEKPKQFMGIRAVFAIRVEVGAKQLTAIPSGRPVTPPQA